MRSPFHALIPASALLAGCMWQGTPVPVHGDLSPLAGKWVGGYSSVETGRNGTITFELTAGADSAYGDVLMSPTEAQNITTGSAPFVPRETPRLPVPLRIAFVQCMEDHVMGALDPYPDPVTGVLLRTNFNGRLVGGEFRGTFVTTAEGSDRVMTGEWSVSRARP